MTTPSFSSILTLILLYLPKVQLDYITSEKFHFLSEFTFEVSIELQDKIQLFILGFQLFQGRYWYFVS